MLRFIVSLGLALLGHTYLFQYTIDLGLETPPQLISNTTVSVTLNDSLRNQDKKLTSESKPPPSLEHEEEPSLTPPSTAKRHSPTKKKHHSVPIKIIKTEKKKKFYTVPADLDERCDNTPVKNDSSLKKLNERPQQEKQTGKNLSSQTSSHEAVKISKNSASNQTTSSVIKAIPLYQYNPKPEYPQLARRRGWEGIVSLLVDVTENGYVASIDLHESCGYKILDKAAIRAVKTWRFSPGTRDGQRTPSTVVIPVHFRLYD